jgi:uncharacterized protein
VLFVSGNHEVYSGGEKVINIVKRSGINVIDNKIINIDGLQFIGIAYPNLSRKNDIFDIKTNPDFDPNQPGILLFHTPTDIGEIMANKAVSHSKAYIAPATKFETAEKIGISLQLSGHTHAGQFIPFTWLTRLIYNNFHYGLHRMNDFYIYISSGTGTWGPPLRSGCLSEIAIITLIQAKD